jgi:hypothetical protein
MERRFDKNSLWDELNIAKKGVVRQEEEITRYGGLSQDLL